MMDAIPATANPNRKLSIPGIVPVIVCGNHQSL